MRVTVVGAGVIGLTCAIRLAQAGHTVDVVAGQRTPHTTSDVAAAIHFPYLAQPRDRIQAWAAESLAVFRRLATDPAAGVAWHRTHVIEPKPDPWWRDLVDDFRDQGPQEQGFAYACRVPVISMPRHMRFLETWCERLGVQFRAQTLTSLQQVSGVDAVIHASGLGARELASDGSVHPIQGQVARVHLPDFQHALVVESDPPTYAIPRPDGVVVGGTAVVGATSLVPNPDTEAAILRRAAAFVPGLATAPVLGRAVGLRPGRPSIRLELDEQGPRPVVHCYGHGGSGVTLSWGCASEVTQIVQGLSAG